MDVKVAYLYKSNNTRKVGQAIAQALGAQELAVDGRTPAPQADVLFLGSGVYAGMAAGAIKKLARRLEAGQVKRVALYSTSSRGDYPLKDVRAILAKQGIDVYPETFSCASGSLDEAALARAGAFAKKVTEQ